MKRPLIPLNRSGRTSGRGVRMKLIGFPLTLALMVVPMPGFGGEGDAVDTRRRGSECCVAPDIVGGVERVGQLAGHGEHLVHRERPAGKAGGEVLAVDQLHHERGSFESVDLRDVGMVQGGEGAGLTFEPLEPVWIAGEDIRKDFDRDVAMQLCVTSTVDFAHPPDAQGILHLVRSAPGAGRQETSTADYRR